VPAGFDYDMWIGPSPYKPYTPQRVSRTWMFIHDYGLGCMGGAWGIHDVDMAQWVSDNDNTTPIETEGEGIFFDDIRDTEHTWTVEHKYANGVKVIHMDIATAKKRADQFNFGSMASVMFGTEGWIYVSRQGMHAKPESLLHQAIGPNEKKVIPSNDHRRDFLNAVKTGGATIANVDSAAHGEMVNQQADIAMRLKRKLRWDPVKEEFIRDEQANRMMERPMRSPWRAWGETAMKKHIAILAQCFQAVAQQAPATFEEALAKVAAYQPGDDQKAISDLQRAVATGSGTPEKAKQMEQALLGALDRATPLGKEQLCRQLSLTGSAASVPALSKMLDSDDTADMARYALERIPGAAVNQALREMLGKTSGRVQAGIANTLGERKDMASRLALRNLLASNDAVVAVAGAAALGEIGDAAGLAAVRPKSTGALRAEVDEAYLHAAELAGQEGDRKGAFAIYKELSGRSETETTRIAALAGVAKYGDKEALPLLAAAIDSREPKVRAQAIRQLNSIPGREATAALSCSFAGLDSVGKVRVLTALGERGDKAAFPVLLNATKDAAQPVRVVAFQGLGKIGDSSAVLLLAETASKGVAVEQAASKDFSSLRTGGFPNEHQLAPAPGLTENAVARESLYRLRGAEIDQAIVSAIPKAQPEVKVELIAACAARPIPSATPVLLANAADVNRDVRRAALRALRETAGPSDVPALITLMSSCEGADRAEAGRVVASALRRSEKTSIDPVMSAYRGATDGDLKGALLAVLGEAGRDESLQILRNAAKDTTPEIRRGAILALSEWPSPAPMSDLLAAARRDPVPAYQVLALQG